MSTTKLPESIATVIREQTHRIHCAVNDGTLDREIVNDALAKLTELADPKPAESAEADAKVDKKSKAA